MRATSHAWRPAQNTAIQVARAKCANSSKWNGLEEYRCSERGIWRLVSDYCTTYRMALRIAITNCNLRNVHFAALAQMVCVNALSTRSVLPRGKNRHGCGKQCLAEGLCPVARNSLARSYQSRLDLALTHMPYISETQAVVLCDAIDCQIGDHDDPWAYELPGTIFVQGNKWVWLAGKVHSADPLAFDLHRVLPSCIDTVFAPVLPCSKEPHTVASLKCRYSATTPRSVRQNVLALLSENPDAKSHTLVSRLGPPTPGHLGIQRRLTHEHAGGEAGSGGFVFITRRKQVPIPSAMFHFILGPDPPGPRFVVAA